MYEERVNREAELRLLFCKAEKVPLYLHSVRKFAICTRFSKYPFMFHVRTVILWYWENEYLTKLFAVKLGQSHNCYAWKLVSNHWFGFVELVLCGSEKHPDDDKEVDCGLFSLWVFSLIQLFSYNLLYIQHKQIVLLQTCKGRRRGFNSLPCGKHLIFVNWSLFVGVLRPGGFLYPHKALLNQVVSSINSLWLAKF